eukprot:NODE_276_length_2159_cov_7.341535_g270_i0.p2 GENE.NODE_276_length_2159_cov_7.341535_g270_i0~~NODE_276_length_2159_cov_7.341535_g270_i0.p2  ORF type:complete len:201 (+),score=4.78 NODE_276_length_2159_cov_7.341535_g270_i0:379-981(+)
MVRSGFTVMCRPHVRESEVPRSSTVKAIPTYTEERKDYDIVAVAHASHDRWSVAWGGVTCEQHFSPRAPALAQLRTDGTTNWTARKLFKPTALPCDVPVSGCRPRDKTNQIKRRKTPKQIRTFTTNLVIQASIFANTKCDSATPFPSAFVEFMQTPFYCERGIIWGHKIKHIGHVRLEHRGWRCSGIHRTTNWVDNIPAV